ncbi:helix-turn-helix transcriptional regulator [Myroides marinus]|jgi:transcriptional regulator with XRE-family HTH domain|uniref:DNA-binding protein n=1 Tax=Myroides marinus TaxID=703342 RepID=A0A163W8N4_9FLAO|nr:helix-turn-helix transcriptional regulator [Myroides marinus]MDR0196115.1 helix-turn-helix domain-containing protein [Myroides sp.]KUF38614.1 DNA-binding protein [Myroides marinus]KZE76026.1 DNA-binding protein [Myroides marinus]MDM1347533.1 helix-turn-helix transcriptional regulator [Myroides marinus]MDM1350825.1 helix-turn-helix transcriptional regulator [Myroides marinus]
MDVEKIKSIRKNSGYSQEYVAERLGISQKAYSDIESGKTKLKNEVLYEIAKILDISPAAICPISCECISSIENKHKELLAYLDAKGVEYPTKFI